MPTKEAADFQRMDEDFLIEGRELSFSQDEWTLAIMNDTSTSSLETYSLTLRISFETNKHTRSLHWRNDCEGHSCVYTCAASVNNRGLFPYQVSQNT